MIGLSPVVLVGASWVWDASVGPRMLHRTQMATQELSQSWAEGGPQAADRVARRWGVRLRVVDAEGALLADADHEAAPRWTDSVFFANTTPTLAAHDATLEPLARRDEVEVARVLGNTGACERSPDGGLLVCHHALSQDGVVLHATESSRRGLRGLRGMRYQVARLTLISLLIAFGVGAWLGWRIVRPIELLRDQVLSRAATRGSIEPVVLDRDDEVGDLAQAFNALLTTLRERDEATERFIADFAHEVKNPAAAVRASAEALERGESVSPERAARLARVLRRSSQRLDDVVTGFLELARAEGGLGAQPREEVELRALLEGVIEQARLRVGEGVAVELEVQGEDLRVQAVPVALESALRNLVDNGISFAQATLRVEARADELGVTLTVTDDGPGIAEADQGRVFERFYTTRAGKEGTGLGLPLARAVFEAHGGRLVVSSAPGEGARFEGWLPREPAG
ncbi:MAG: HAMP domain-containing histidine kinase [Alphaproteobacteria bacterium]|nr:HAMP domain-containing histidine kinase [Alphaproteobacteria bacterium]MCB9794468.1 HAMP domain-containing histidine kinase [Alphaproteobacteria bacterium]